MGMNAEALLLMARKLNVQLDVWAAEKQHLEARIYTAETTQNHKQAVQLHDNALLDITLGLQKQELQLATFKLETALDDAAVCQTRVALLKSQLQRAKETMEELKKQARARESYFSSKEAEFNAKLRKAFEKNSMTEVLIQELQQQIEKETQGRQAEIARERAEAEHCKERLANALPSLLSEKDSLWLQLKNVEAECSSLDKLKDEQLLLALDEICKLEQQIEGTQEDARKHESVVNALKGKLKGTEPLSLPHNMANHNQVESEVRKVLDRVDEMKLENEKLRALCNEMESKLGDARKPRRGSKKDGTSQSLSPAQHRSKTSKRKAYENSENLNPELAGKRRKGSTLSSAR